MRPLIFLTLLMIAGTATASDLSEIREDVLRSANVTSAGLPNLTTADVDSLIVREARSFHGKFPNAIVKQDTLALVANQFMYTLNSDIGPALDSIPITFCIGKERRSDDSMAVYFALRPVLAKDFWTAAGLTLSGAVAEYPEIVDLPQIVSANAGQLMVWPVPRYADTLIVGYRATQGSLTAATDLVIDDAYRAALIEAVVVQVLRKLEL